jgi:hypothetical protein
MHRKPVTSVRVLWRLGSALALVATLGFVGRVSQFGVLSQPTGHAYAAGCQLGNGVSNVFFMTFDNTHFTRDIPNVPSDLEQMPNLLNFLTKNGTLLTNHHTPLISHTANDILTAFTGVYADKHGVPVANSYRYFNPDGTSSVGVSFGYWTAPVFDPTTTTPTDKTYNMVNDVGMNTPAPWVPFTRAGCNVGGAGTANMVLENTATDIAPVFGAGSPQAQEVTSNPAQAFADFVGVGVHCAAGDPVCSTANGGLPDKLPDEPGGYTGYQGLFGHKYLAQAISPTAPLTDLNGNQINDGNGHIGFPGFDGMPASTSLAYVAAMHEHGIPVTFSYISDAHDKHPSGPAYGPGQAGYVAALKSADDAFGKFFARLAADGINASNSLFVITSDEGDHFVGGKPTPANCDGVNIPCTYPQIGELNANIAGMLATQQNNTTPFSVHSDDSPTVYVKGNPLYASPTVRNLERAFGGLTNVNSMTGGTDNLLKYLVDPVGEKILHMVTSDPMRTPTFTFFGNPDYFMFTGAPNCSSPCVTQQPGFAWDHGGFDNEVVTTWAGIVGPGVKNGGIDPSTWTDHTDLRPTMLTLAGLQDDYAHDGRVITEVLKDSVIPTAIKNHSSAWLSLAQAYKQLNACVGQFGLATVQASTKAIMSNDPGDVTYNRIEGQLYALGVQKASLAGQISSLLDRSAFAGTDYSDLRMLALNVRAVSLIFQAQILAAS